MNKFSNFCRFETIQAIEKSNNKDPMILQFFPLINDVIHIFKISSNEYALSTTDNILLA